MISKGTGREVGEHGGHSGGLHPDLPPPLQHQGQYDSGGAYALLRRLAHPALRNGRVKERVSTTAHSGEVGHAHARCGVARLDAHAVENGWIHIGRLWTSGEPYLAVDASIRHQWRGFSQEEHFDRIVDLGEDETSIRIGEHVAAVGGRRGRP